MTTDIIRMYRAIVLPEYQRDLHRFVWREDPSQPLKDFRMTQNDETNIRGFRIFIRV